MINVGKDLPTEYISNDSTRRHNIVADSRIDFGENKDTTYAVRGEMKRNKAIEHLYFDNLDDFTFDINRTIFIDDLSRVTS